MRNRMRVLTVAAAGIATSLAACGGSSTGPSPESLVGTWTATRAEFALLTNPAMKVEIIRGGATLKLELNSNQTYRVTTTTPGEPTDIKSGSWSASADVLTLHLPNGEMQFDMSLTGNTLTLTGGHTPFDVNRDGMDEECTLNLILTR